MALWLVKTDKFGEHEVKFINDKRVHLAWHGLENSDMSGIKFIEEIKQIIEKALPHLSRLIIRAWTGQVFAFVIKIKPSDLFVLPLNSVSKIAVGEIQSPYRFDPAADPLYRHYHEVKWLNTEIPRRAFDQDLRLSLLSGLTVCEIKHNDAERRIRAMLHTSPLSPWIKKLRRFLKAILKGL